MAPLSKLSSKSRLGALNLEFHLLGAAVKTLSEQRSRREKLAARGKTAIEIERRIKRIRDVLGSAMANGVEPDAGQGARKWTLDAAKLLNELASLAHPRGAKSDRHGKRFPGVAVDPRYDTMEMPKLAKLQDAIEAVCSDLRAMADLDLGAKLTRGERGRPKGATAQTKRLWQIDDSLERHGRRATARDVAAKYNKGKQQSKRVEKATVDNARRERKKYQT